jgi:hypothetical protein
VAVPAAAAVLLLVVPFLSSRDSARRAPAFRGAEPAVRLLIPSQEVQSSPFRFVWTRDPRASRYRFELYDEALRRIYRTVTADTALVLADSIVVENVPIGSSPRAVPSRVSPSTPRERHWRVFPLTAVGLELPASAPAPFTASP